ncbi:4-(cytidine 5'-diphospho)-2-C-methyl-D-erythritol kinase [Gilliamella sp. wkB178]|uniref:4-(cytidine 5'-diphospho)-2-C-methyl-D-erythritol kinase n=1 Tax=Gilliamella sp. wkB178 TaxID=3120259 RepID=UPI00080E35FC|nr:4-(cytidine 5'-diphospho)-2-C-methyl-D-erythritol kinase [Gilliamella apicola]OCG08784.1 4-(cytidine 5'-diphospho)-2-C-methyl-D-erythritol kinase [Gilliamella apicola]
MKPWLAPAKLNLFLYITGRRADNYHNLQTLFQFIDYCDQLTFNLRQDGQINLLTEFTNIPSYKNLMVIAAQKLKTFANRPDLGVDMAIDKNIPMGGGLGGASSNAATVLVALNQLWQLNLTTQQLMDLGRSIGADVPIFIYGHSAFAQGIGDQFQALTLPQHWYLVTCPNIEISTATVFNDPQLNRNSAVRTVDELMALPFSEHYNDCEAVVRKRYPQINNIITQLSRLAPTRLTGTGACVFSQCESQQQAQAMQAQLVAQSIPSIIAKSLNKSPLYPS